mmetsp:Transcript_35497/g.57437  ORF Transcript_35497/g.57437 Transcript_35497/m.57437 type:complete len:243 (-) Transcript_35497:246-974(-)
MMEPLTNLLSDRKSLSDARAVMVHEKMDTATSSLEQIKESVEELLLRHQRLRKRLSEVSAVTKMLAVSKQESKGMKDALELMASCLQSMETDERVMEDRCQLNIIKTIELFKMQTNATEKALEDREKAVKTMKAKSIQLEKLQQHAGNMPVAKASASYETALTRATQAETALRETIYKFEQKRIEDFKFIFMELAHSHMLFFANAVQSLSQAFDTFQAINIDVETTEFLDQYDRAGAPLDKK